MDELGRLATPIPAPIEPPSTWRYPFGQPSATATEKCGICGEWIEEKGKKDNVRPLDRMNEK